ncbi:MAG: cation-transporting P-type ATPase [Verrucomicrobiae bacterium]|nr:cation-transporting P-type ATPase [Verrucomicrobiae bacterium]
MKIKHPEPVWHALADTEVVRLLDVDLRHGLSDAEIRSRQKQFGPNRLTARRGTPEWKRFVQQFNQPLVYILLVAAGVTLALHEYIDSTVIFLVVMINALVGYLQESKAEKAIEALARMVTTEATVRRNGHKDRIPAEELVPGDIVLLQSGDKVPADLRLFHNKSLQVDESALTGESLPVQKNTDPVALDSLLAERSNLAYAGTLVTYGQAEGVVWAIGNQTETGRIARLIGGAISLATPLTRKIHQFSNVLLWAILALATMAFVIGLARGEKAVDIFMAAVALAVGAIPEGLPAAVTITLAIGVNRMAQRRAIIRKLPAVETLGSTTVICSDKTGTLTENQMTVQEIHAGGRVFRVTGTGYGPEGAVLEDGKPVNLGERAALRECLVAGLLCNDTQIVSADGRWQVQGDPTEAALSVAAGKAGLSGDELNSRHGRIDSIPFESEHQFMATLHGHHEPGRRVIFKKGSVEKLLERSHDMLLADGNTGPLDADAIRAAADGMASRGMRVLAIARRHTDTTHEKLEHHHVAGELTFVGLQGMIDPPRREAVESVAKCQAAGVQVKMITGDHVVTATAVAAQLGLTSPDGSELISVTGRDLEKTSDEDLPALAERASVFARVAPEQKLKLVRALQQRGHVVAMTGDGVNDAPALKQADIGVAMGISGTEVAKGAADMLLTDDNFSSIEAAVEEGRGVFDNLTKFIVWTLPTNAGEGLIILAAIFLGTALPVMPVHILWINMATAILLGLMLVFEPKETNLMLRRPRNPAEPLLTPTLLQRIVLVTLFMVSGAFGLFLLERRVLGAELAQAQTVVVNAIVMVEAAYLLNCRSLTHSMFHIGFFTNRWIFIGIGGMAMAQLLITYAPPLNRLFHTAPIGLTDWGHILLVGVLTHLAVEAEKWFRRRNSH